VVQGTRGRFKSGGAFYPLRHERQDGIETLQWLARQPWFDGRLGMWGGSAFGHTQWALADQSRPSPTALMRDQRGVIGRSAMAARSSRLAPSRRARSSDII
jgi:predicted acyl esterase